MSLLNVYLGGDVALVGVDTDARNPDHPERGDFPSTKMSVLPLSSAVFAFRGERTFGFMAALKLGACDSGDFDELAERFVDCLGWTVGHAREAGATDDDIEGDYVLVGWSVSLGRVRCASVRIDPAAGTMNLTDSAERSFRFWKAPPAAPDVDSVEGMRACARLQVIDVRANHPDFAIGGTLILARISRGRVAVSNEGPIE